MKISQKQAKEFAMTLLALYRESPDVRKLSYAHVYRKALDVERHVLLTTMKKKVDAATPKKRVRMCPECDVQPRSKTLHECPYKAEIRGDLATLCACCANCQNKCSQDI